jgi:hypothetical protein
MQGPKTTEKEAVSLLRKRKCKGNNNNNKQKNNNALSCQTRQFLHIKLTGIGIAETALTR